jgi:hypothetical protein
MAFDPNEPRDKGGKWSKSGYGPGQTLKGKYAGPQTTRPNTGQIPGQIDTGKRFGRMNSTSKAALTSKATFKSKLVGPSKKLKGKVIGSGPASVMSDERLLSHYQSNTVEKRKGGGRFQDTGRAIGPKIVRDHPKELNLFARHDSPAAVAIQTAKALDKDFHREREKAQQADMKAAIAKHQGSVTKLSAGPRPKYDHKGKMK